MSPLAIAGATVGVLAVILWAASLRSGRVDAVDVAWPIFHLAPGLIYVAHAAAVQPTARQLMLATLLCLWASRLATYLATRSAGAEEDRRYQAIRQANEPGFRFKSLYLIFVFQAALAWLISAMLYPIAIDAAPLGWIDIGAGALTLFGIVYETVADRQLSTFRATATDRVLGSGLWRYCRHPNYFGEWCVWCGFTVLALTAGAWWALGGWALVTVLLLRVSGVGLMERDIDERRPGYADYKRTTNAFLPGRPRRAGSVASVALVAFLLAGGSSTAEPSSVERYTFEALIGDRVIGRHEFRLLRRGDVTEVESRADFEVRVLLFKAFWYRHEALERYQDGCLRMIRAETDANGKRYEVDGRLDTDGFRLSANGRATALPECIMSFAYWDERILRQDRLLNSQTGDYTKVTVDPLGPRPYWANGARLIADAYRLTGDTLELTVFYAREDGRWLGLEAEADGRTLTYRPIGG